MLHHSSLVQSVVDSSLALFSGKLSVISGRKARNEIIARGHIEMVDDDVDS